MDNIIYTIRNTLRSKKIQIAIRSDGSIVVSKSPRVSVAQVEIFVQQKKSWIKEKILEQTSRPKKLLAHYSTKDFHIHKESARVLVYERIKHFNAQYQFTVGRVTIRNQQSRWGSCSSKGNLNFNYKLVFLPQELADYVIVHELCHLKEMNHGKRFWQLVAEQIPDYKYKRKQIQVF